MNQLTQIYLKSILKYDPLTGLFTRIKYPYKTPNNVNNSGYKRIGINNKSYLVHRLAWLYVMGYMPNTHIDHINHNRQDNRWENLRLASFKINSLNTSKRKDNKSGIVGVDWYPISLKWRVQIQKNQQKYFLGYFVDFFEACCARKSAEKQLGFHSNHGK